jgi:hypothetical protein
MQKQFNSDPIHPPRPLYGSPRDPLGEANKWLLRNEKVLSKSRQIVLLGLGLGHHLKALTEKYSDRETWVYYFPEEFAAFKVNGCKFDFDDKQVTVHVVEVSKNQTAGSHSFVPEIFTTHLPSSNIGILCFRPAWQGNELEYLKMLNRLNGRDSVTLAESLENLGLPFAAAQVRKNQSSANIKSVDLNNLVGTPDWNYWKILKEQVK